MAAGFLVFIAGQTLVLSGSAMTLEASSAVFAAGAALWAAALVLISLPKVMPLPTRVLGGLAALLFALTALQIFAGEGLTPLSQPLPFFAYPVFVLTLFGWAWWCLRTTPSR
jgi:drug/metabolite transporter (DMT)-like permease